MRSLAFLLILFVVVGFGSWYLFSHQNNVAQTSLPTPTSITSPTTTLPFTAHFLIFTNGTRRIFTDSRYHNLSPDVYINPEKPNSAVVNTKDITWGDFFATLPMRLTKECLTTGTGQNFCSDETAQLMFYVNGSSDPDALDKAINPGDRLLVSYGQAEAVTDQLQQLEEIN